MHAIKHGHPKQLDLFPIGQQGQFNFEEAQRQFIRVGTTIIRIWETPGENPEFPFLYSTIGGFGFITLYPKFPAIASPSRTRTWSDQPADIEQYPHRTQTPMLNPIRVV
jgi:hypothetical protein